MLHKPFDVYKETVKVKSMTRNRLSRTILPRNPISKFPLQNPAKIQILWLIHLVLKSHLGRGKENMFFVVGQFWDCTKRSCYTRKVKSYNFLSWRSRGLLNRLLIFPESLHTPLFLLNLSPWQPLLFFDCTEVARPMIFFCHIWHTFRFLSNNIWLTSYALRVLLIWLHGYSSRSLIA